MPSRTKRDPLRWAELTPAGFQRRRAARSLVWIPAGLCEPHGQGVPLGLDLIKAEQLCLRAAEAHGGIVAPALGWHIHACGPSARFLEENVGEVEPHLGHVGPEAFAQHLVHTLAACAGAGFRQVVVVSGHHGAHAEDLGGMVARVGLALEIGAAYVTDIQLAAASFKTDHAGSFELSEIMELSPGLIDFDDIGEGGRLAAAPDARDASIRRGRKIVRHLVTRLGEVAAALPSATRPADAPAPTPGEVQGMWHSESRQFGNWTCLRPRLGQPPVSERSRWKPGEHTLPVGITVN